MFSYLPTLLLGLPVSLILMIVAVLIALLLSILFTIIIMLNMYFISQLVKLYIILFTGTPFLVQLFLIYYGPGEFALLYTNPWLWSLLSQPWLCAILALALNSAAYSTQLFVRSTRTIPPGLWQACTALGMSKLQSLRVLMPFAIKKSLTSYTNEIILVFKSTSLVYTITIMDIMGYSQLIYGRTYDFLVFCTAGIIYLAINSMLRFLMYQIERRALRFALCNEN
ncbi:arginine ABC transporter permease ArtM [Candidatus Palibaumannia cicadellinicola]|uniref:Arginine ABC transporter permease protein ArtM n=1 Tax=Candidatus Palibaumannia cicadellinicola TaxID=186490 RepID=A0A088N1P9_9GAMM|nr:arginine ABC transporter permease ArtM [Candidatus Baumannia cicadellinicola]AIN47246.1 Arginine ABC transporter, permease protein ArtM [Candidatus Baumannia cicadellinicola]